MRDTNWIRRERPGDRNPTTTEQSVESAMAEVDETTVEQALAELREMFPDASFISVKTHAIYQQHWTHGPQADVQIEDRGFRRETLADCMAQVRAWREQIGG